MSPSPLPGQTATASKSASQDDQPRRGIDGIGQTDRPLPAWVVGTPAKIVLIEALARIARHGGDAMAISCGRHAFEALEVRLPGQGDTNDTELAAFADAVLEELGEKRADVLVLGGHVRGRSWQTILHISAGAASFV
jgi:hypothetical protein